MPRISERDLEIYKERGHQITRLERDKQDLAARLTAALPMIFNASYNLASVFGEMTQLGTDEKDETLVLSANDGLAMVTLNPVNGQLVVSDPHGVVQSIRVTIDPEGHIDLSGQMAIQRFRADVLYAKQAGAVRIEYPISLTTRRPSGSPEDVSSLATGPIPTQT